MWNLFCVELVWKEIAGERNRGNRFSERNRSDLQSSFFLGAPVQTDFCGDPGEWFDFWAGARNVNRYIIRLFIQFYLWTGSLVSFSNVRIRFDWAGGGMD